MIDLKDLIGGTITAFSRHDADTFAYAISVVKDGHTYKLTADGADDIIAEPLEG